MSGQPIAHDELLRLLEAARWAPSSANGQPWRFVYALAGTAAFDLQLGLLLEGNRVWCGRASALLLVASKRTFDTGRPSPTHAFDAGAAWMSLSLQGAKQGLVVHGMRGFDVDRARQELAVPEDYELHCMVAVGWPGKVEELPEALRAREQPSDRVPLARLAFAERWPQEP